MWILVWWAEIRNIMGWYTIPKRSTSKSIGEHIEYYQHLYPTIQRMYLNKAYDVGICVTFYIGVSIYIYISMCVVNVCARVWSNRTEWNDWVKPHGFSGGSVSTTAQQRHHQAKLLTGRVSSLSNSQRCARSKQQKSCLPAFIALGSSNTTEHISKPNFGWLDSVAKHHTAQSVAVSRFSVCVCVCVFSFCNFTFNFVHFVDTFHWSVWSRAVFFGRR